MIVYKVLTKDLRSIWLSYHDMTERWAIQYKENKWVKPHPNTQLMAFRNLEEARLWANSIFASYVIYKCEALESKKRTFCFSAPSHLFDFLYIIKESPNTQEVIRIINADQKYILEGTVFCDKIKLLERVL